MTRTAHQKQVARVQDHPIWSGLFSPKSRHLNPGQPGCHYQNDPGTGCIPDEDATGDPSVPSFRVLKRLIVNADDWGLTPGVNRGIVRAFQHGIVTSASLLVTGSAFEEAVALARDFPAPDVGLHLALVEEQALFVLPGSQPKSHSYPGMPLSSRSPKANRLRGTSTCGRFPSARIHAERHDRQLSSKTRHGECLASKAQSSQDRGLRKILP